jgi:hypothetical protein
VDYDLWIAEIGPDIDRRLPEGLCAKQNQNPQSQQNESPMGNRCADQAREKPLGGFGHWA